MTLIYKKIFYISYLCLLFGMTLTSSTAYSQSLNSNFPVTNGMVYGFYQSDDSLYIGGSFTYIGKSAGSAVLIDPGAASPNNVDVNFPKTNGNVYASCPDGSGGWFIGGEFTLVGGIARQNLAHIKSDYSVDPLWNPTISGSAGVVFVVAVYGGKLYIGGSFGSVNGSSRGSVASFDIATASLTNWNPRTYTGYGGTGQVNTLAFTSTTVFIGGVFHNINSTAAQNVRNCLGEVNISDGLLTTFNQTTFNSWNGSNASFAATNVNKLYYNNNDTLYVLGKFDIGTYYNKGIAAIKLSSNLVTSWDPTIAEVANGSPFTFEFNDIQIKGDTVYLGGKFTSFLDPMDLSTVYTRNDLVAVSRSGTLSTPLTNGFGVNVYVPVFYGWDPNVQGTALVSDPGVSALATIGNTVYASGKFNRVGGTAHQNLVGINTGTGSVTWDPNLKPSEGEGTINGILTLSTANGKLLAGGDIYMYGGVNRNGLAKIIISTGKIENWNPNLSPSSGGTAYASQIEGYGGTLFMTGSFTAVDGVARDNFAAIDKATGSLSTTFNVAVNSVGGMKVFNGKLYLRGSFTSVGGQTRYGLASIDLSTNTVTAWNPNTAPPNGGISGFTIHGTTLYACGTFTSLGGQSRIGLGAVDINSGNVTSWTATTSGTYGSKVRAIAYANNSVFIGGAFTSVNGVSRQYIAGLDPATGATTSWNPGIAYSNGSSDGSPGFYTVIGSPDGTMIFAGGKIDSVSGASTQNGLVEFSASTGAIQSWNPGLVSNYGGVEIRSLLMDAGGQNLFVGGMFRQVGAETNNNVADFSFPSALPVELTSFSGEIKNKEEVYLKWNTATEINNYGFDIEKSSDNRKFKKIGFVQGNGNSNSPKEYSFEDKLKQFNKIYYYRLKQIDIDGNFKYSSVVEINSGAGLNKKLSLVQNYPNPFNPTTTIRYQLPANSFVTLKIYDILGSEVKTLVNRNQEAGNYKVIFDAKNLSSGIYFYRLSTGKKVLIKKMILLK